MVSQLSEKRRKPSPNAGGDISRLTPSGIVPLPAVSCNSRDIREFCT